MTEAEYQFFFVWREAPKQVSALSLHWTGLVRLQ